MSRRHALAVMTTTALLAAAAGCTGGEPSAPAQAAPAAKFTALEVPAELGPTRPTVDQVGILGAAGSAPWSIHAIRTEPGGLPRAVVWAADGAALPSEPTELPGDGEVRSLVVAGSGELTVAVIAVRSDGVESTQVVTSVDRRVWSPVAVPALSGVATVSATVVGEEAIVVGTDRASGEPVGVVLAADGSSEPLGMPDQPEGTTSRLHLQAVAGHVGEMALVVSQDRGGPDDAVSVYRSVDRGATWVEDPVDGVEVRVEGFAATTDGYVLTGHTRLTRDSREMVRASVWTAKRQVRGVTRAADAPDGGLLDSWIGAPAAAPDGGYRAELGGPGVSNVALVDETKILAVSDALDARGMLGQTAVDEDGTVRTVAARAHGATVLALGQDASGEQKLVAVGSLAPAQYWLAPYGAVGTDVLGAAESHYVDWKQGYRSRSQHRRYTLDASRDAIVEVPADAVVEGDEDRRVDVQGPNGKVALVSGYAADYDGVRSTPWARTTDGQWQRGQDLPGDNGAGGTPVWVAGQWLVPGTTSASTDKDDADSAALWSSPDGLTWSLDETFPGEEGESADVVCALGVQDALVLGDLQGEHTVRARVAGTWQDSTLAANGRRDPHDCFVAKDGRTVIRFTEGDGELLVATKDGTDEDELLSTGPDASFGAVHVIADGYVATGSVRDDDGFRAVLWVSGDGLRWDHVPGPAGESSLRGLAVIDGTVVAVAGDARGARAWRVDDLDKVLSAASVKMDQ